MREGYNDSMHNILLSNVSFSEIKGNELFEAGSSAILVGDNNGAIISNNNIVWTARSSSSPDMPMGFLWP